MTDISVRKAPAVQSEDRSWLASPHGTETNAMPGITVDTGLFPAATKTNGYIKSGTVLGRVTATGLYGPYDTTATDGRQVPEGLLFQSIDTSHGDRKFGTAELIHGFVFGSKLPGGTPSAAVKTALPLIHFYA
ncbi:head decoration protein [Amycolatopsis sp. PS_44_ISF1]|uniref:head decoration protein n=1 Tax=Amycolatopsis sp. PS_44_ISF1 TaxID=2974917 RepID=UPI0028DDD4B6|nr:head decoration protein [Amycolatopsis sp. PS_44_ISF1]MDT8915752.1 head decoration protein [Amycolatopsis sp. PS_44_ISF1]